MDSRSCFLCRAELPAGEGYIFCPKCSAPHFFGDVTSPFLVLGAPKSYAIDEKALEERYYLLSKYLHPDRFASAGVAALARSQELSAVLNQAYLALRSREERLEALLTDAGAITGSVKPEANQKIPAELAEEFFELQEAVMDGGDEAKGLALAFRRKLSSRESELNDGISSLAVLVDWRFPQKEENKSKIQTIIDLRQQRSYVRSMITNLDRLEEQAS